MPDIGQQLVGAYLKLVKGCGVVDYGVDDVDVLGLNVNAKRAYACVVATHPGGLKFGDTNHETIKTLAEKHERQVLHAGTALKGFDTTFMLWSPNVERGYLVGRLNEIGGLDLVVNRDYKAAVDELTAIARKQHADSTNPAFRMLQILANIPD